MVEKTTAVYSSTLYLLVHAVPCLRHKTRKKCRVECVLDVYMCSAARTSHVLLPQQSIWLSPDIVAPCAWFEKVVQGVTLFLHELTVVYGVGDGTYSAALLLCLLVHST